jgi:TetR/AcrR family transcriptional repressor of mexJK operon
MASYLAELNERCSVHGTDLETANSLFLIMLSGNHRFRCLLGLQSGLSAAGKHKLTNAAITLFPRGLGYA